MNPMSLITVNIGKALPKKPFLRFHGNVHHNPERRIIQQVTVCLLIALRHIIGGALDTPDADMAIFS